MLLIKPELASNLDSLAAIQKALRYAIELEHATIPPYLYAMYSLGTDNQNVAGIIGSVVGEEMAHFALACNILNAIGGQPAIDSPKFIPTYPGPLPATVESGLKVPLAPASKKLVEKVFMTIEEPEDPPDIPHHGVTAMASGRPLTIGLFYHRIKAAIEDVSSRGNIFTGDHALQVTHHFATAEVVPVYSVGDASSAIDLIVEQGEGTHTSPLEGDELAHFFRFREIVEGYQLVPAPGAHPPWRFDGPPIPFAENKVLDVIENPKTSKYPAGSAARIRCQTFNYTYTNLLKVLHDTFNGHPDRLPTAIGLMESLNEQAQALMATDSELGAKKAGPSFEYQLTN